LMVEKLVERGDIDRGDIEGLVIRSSKKSGSYDSAPEEMREHALAVLERRDGAPKPEELPLVTSRQATRLLGA